MGYQSLLSDAHIAELLGLKLVGKPLKDLPAMVKIGEFREDFESELEERLTEEYERVIDVVKGVAIDSVKSDISNSIGERRFKTNLYLNDPQIEIEDTGDKIKLYITASGYIGKATRGTATNSDIYRLGKLFVDPTEISFNHTEGLHFDRNGIEVKPLDKPVQLAGRSLDSNYYFQITYVAEVPKAMFAEIYKQHMPATG